VCPPRTDLYQPGCSKLSGHVSLNPFSILLPARLRLPPLSVLGGDLLLGPFGQKFQGVFGLEVSVQTTLPAKNRYFSCLKCSVVEW
jgi:hypothetical protein